MAEALAAQAMRSTGNASLEPVAMNAWELVSTLSKRDREAVQPHPPGLARLSVDEDTQHALQTLPPVLRQLLSRQLQSMLRAQAWLDEALTSIPVDVSRGDLLNERIPLQQLAALAPMVNLPALNSGMQELLEATETLGKSLKTLAQQNMLPPVVWRHQAPQGWIEVDTTGASLSQSPDNVWLWVKTGGNDVYQLDRWSGTEDRRAVRVLLDTGGNDRYTSTQTGADAAAGVLGLAVLWDADGSDHWECARWCQAAALLGAAALVNDGAGTDRIEAQTQAQAYAVGGLAMLGSNLTPHDDPNGSMTHYQALSDAQGSAGPSGVAVLLDAQGDDHYTLAASPVVAPSSQLPDRNRSTGQGMGMGWRLVEGGRALLATAGGVGLLLDLAGNDHYTAQVFAQGAGYHEGLGLLIDAGGHNQHEAAWYALGAAAHGGTGVMVALGRGDDDYRISYVTGLGAGHDASLGWFEDRGGHDRYQLSDMGLGIGSNEGTGVFVDHEGPDCLMVTGTLGRVMGRRVWLMPMEVSTGRGGAGVFRTSREKDVCTR